LNATLGSGGNTGTVIYATNTGASTTNTVTAATDYDYYFILKIGIIIVQAKRLQL